MVLLGNWWQIMKDRFMNPCPYISICMVPWTNPTLLVFYFHSISIQFFIHSISIPSNEWKLNRIENSRWVDPILVKLYNATFNTTHPHIKSKFLLIKFLYDISIFSRLCFSLFVISTLVITCFYWYLHTLNSILANNWIVSLKYKETSKRFPFPKILCFAIPCAILEIMW